MKLIVGLGNPGTQYENTRHNVGFSLIEYISQYFEIKIDKEKFGGLYGEKIIGEEKILFLKPQKYINLSGEVVRKFLDYFKIDITDILIISDDLDLECGKMKFKSKGSAGGHNGLKNIEHHLQTKEYKRLKIGISNNKNMATCDYVLGKPNKEDGKKIENIIKAGPEIIKDFLSLSFENLMNKYNK